MMLHLNVPFHAFLRNQMEKWSKWKMKLVYIKNYLANYQIRRIT